MRLLLIPLFIILYGCAPNPSEGLVSSGTQGIPKNDSEPQMQSEHILVVDPVVTLRNFSTKDIVLGVKKSSSGKSEMYSLPARSKRKIDLSAGTYDWAATAEQTLVKEGSKTFVAGEQYLWDFNLD